MSPKISYESSLNSIQWEEKKNKILRLRGHRCEICQSDDRLKVVHNIYEKRPPWEYPDETYTVLCIACFIERRPLVEAAVNRLRLDLATIPMEDLRICAKGVVE